jgi:hypothetical protein
MLDYLESVFYGRSWHGASLLKTVRELDLDQPTMENDKRFSPWKIVLHCDYWKFEVCNWKADKRLLEDQRSLLREAVRRFPAARLDNAPADSVSYAGCILGAAAHDVCHAAHLRNLGVIGFQVSRRGSQKRNLR